MLVTSPAVCFCKRRRVAACYGHCAHLSGIQTQKEKRKQLHKANRCKVAEEFMAARTHCAATVTVFTPDSSVDQTKQRTYTV